ncbi:hypothetical protein [Acidithiobacillus ferriphilus]|uniref:hypothetical protein n=1 Tax=Acidithiobacillus ferriphilus TaxID=1689834 RepID=UPI00232D0B8F|nr:hypothetical protein [Acidithiobacillus ferriphilus]WCE92702.1 hypothetical protein PJU76_06950 [Acidithiobacillus ferriphilus]
MDNLPEDDRPMYVPARRNFEIVQYPVPRRRPSFLVLFFVVFSALLAFWLFTHWLRTYDVRLSIHHVEKQFPRGFAPDDVHPLHLAISKPALSPMVSFYHLPFSTHYRLVGEIQGKYVATAGPGFFVVISPGACELVAGVRYCDYHGSAVSRFTGVQ